MTYNKKNKDKTTLPLGVKVVYTGDSEEQKTQDLEKALSKFKKIISKEGLIQELKEREFFKSEGRKRYEKKRNLLYRRKTERKKEHKKRLKTSHKKRKKTKSGDNVSE